MNTQINENFVSFEVAKLLKEKGFDCSCEHQYINCSSGYPFLTDIRDDAGCYYKNSEIGQDEYSAPTIQMVMKWLREVHKLYIEFVLNQDVLNEEAVIENYYFFNVSRLDRFANEGGDCKSYKSYEEACEAAIKYCLINLI